MTINTWGPDLFCRGSLVLYISDITDNARRSPIHVICPLNSIMKNTLASFVAVLCLALPMVKAGPCSDFNGCVQYFPYPDTKCAGGQAGQYAPTNNGNCFVWETFYSIRVTSPRDPTSNGAYCYVYSDNVRMLSRALHRRSLVLGVVLVSGMPSMRGLR